MFRLKATFLLGISLFLARSIQAQYYGVTESVVGEWALGLQLGTHYMRGDIPQLQPAYQAGIYGQTAVTRLFDVKFMIDGGLSQGWGTTPSSGFYFNSALNGTQDSLVAYDTTTQIYHNYRFEHYSGSAVLKFNINRLISQTAGDYWDIYLLGGLGMMLYQTRVDAYNESTGMLYDYGTISGGDEFAIREQLTALRDGTYETAAEQDYLNNTFIGDRLLRTTFIVGAGLRIRVSDHLGIGIEGRYQSVLDDLLDGQQWEDNNDMSLDNDHLITAGLTLDYIF